MGRIFLAALLSALTASAALPHAAAQEQEKESSVQGGRIVTEAEVHRFGSTMGSGDFIHGAAKAGI